MDESCWPGGQDLYRTGKPKAVLRGLRKRRFRAATAIYLNTPRYREHAYRLHEQFPSYRAIHMYRDRLPNKIDKAPTVNSPSSFWIHPNSRASATQTELSHKLYRRFSLKPKKNKGNVRKCLHQCIGEAEMRGKACASSLYVSLL